MARGKSTAAKPAKAAPKKKSRGSRKSNAESVTEAKANETEVNKVLDLQPIVIDQRDFKLHYNAIKGATDKKETAMSLLRTAKKRAKEAGPEVLAAVEKAMRFERMDQDDVVKELQIAGYALRHTENPIQLTLHNTLLGDEKETAYKRGFNDGKAGKTANSTYPESSDLHAEYMRGWNHGAADNLGVSREEADKAMADGSAARRFNSDPPHSVDDEDGDENEDIGEFENA